MAFDNKTDQQGEGIFKNNIVMWTQIERGDEIRYLSVSQQFLW